ncbi:MAG TPA: AAA family ATPase [Gaiellales bacterium]|jgi:pilus assembly protein CpaE
MSTSPIKVFITGAANGLAEVREGLADHPEVELVGTAADPAKAGTKLAESGAQVILHGTTATDHVPTAEIEAIRGVTAAPIVLVTSATANALLSEALSAGIFDVVLLPQLTDGIVFTIKKANSLAAGRAPGAGGKTSSTIEGRVVTFFSPKGGAGKTVLACNLAAIFARQQHRKTLFLDLDLQFGDAAIMLGIEPEKTIYDLVMARRELDSDALAGYVTAHSSGVHVLPAPLRPEDAELVTEERLGHLFAVAKESYDVIVVDTPPFFHGPVLSTLDRTDQLVLVASLDVPAVKNIKLTMQTLDLLHYPKERRHLLVNRSGSKVGLKPQEVERALEMKVEFEVPVDREVAVSVNRGVPIAISNPRSGVAKSLQDVADKLVPQRAAGKAESGGGGKKFRRKG